MPTVEQFYFRDQTVYFRCSILNFYNFGRNKHVIIIKKANDSYFSQVLFSIFEIIFSMTNDYVDILYLYYKIVIFIIGRKVCPVGVMYTHYARRK